jgi:hypothetical protein
MDTDQPAGYFQTTWNSTSEHNLPVAAGFYFCRVEAENPSTSSTNKSRQAGQSFVKVIKLTLVK